jgi:hypothetical protein
VHSNFHAISFPFPLSLFTLSPFSFSPPHPSLLLLTLQFAQLIQHRQIESTDSNEAHGSRMGIDIEKSCGFPFPFSTPLFISSLPFPPDDILPFPCLCFHSSSPLYPQNLFYHPFPPFSPSFGSPCSIHPKMSPSALHPPSPPSPSFLSPPPPSAIHFKLPPI